MKTNPNEPIAPTKYTRSNPITGEVKSFGGDGLTKREYFSALCLQALLSAGGKWKIDAMPLEEPIEYANLAVPLADALIERLNRE